MTQVVSGENVLGSAKSEVPGMVPWLRLPGETDSGSVQSEILRPGDDDLDVDVEWCCTYVILSETTTMVCSVSTGEEPPPHSGELKHALSQAGGPTQPQLPTQCRQDTTSPWSTDYGGNIYW